MIRCQSIEGTHFVFLSEWIFHGALPCEILLGVGGPQGKTSARFEVSSPYRGSRLQTLSHEQARRVYDRIGSWQDSQAFYEDRAVGELIRNADFESARTVYEFGCGTGRFAERILSDCLPSVAKYRGLDISPRMVGLASARLKEFWSRAEVLLTDGGPPSRQAGDAPDRFVANYALDLLSDEDIRGVIRAAAEILEPGGLLCLTSLSFSRRWSARLVLACWSALRSIHPAIVGGCRPLSLRDHLPVDTWEVKKEVRILQFGVPSQVVIAVRR